MEELWARDHEKDREFLVESALDLWSGAVQRMGAFGEHVGKAVGETQEAVADKLTAAVQETNQAITAAVEETNQAITVGLTTVKDQIAQVNISELWNRPASERQPPVAREASVRDVRAMSMRLSPEPKGSRELVRRHEDELADAEEDGDELADAEEDGADPEHQASPAPSLIPVLSFDARRGRDSREDELAGAAGDGEDPEHQASTEPSLIPVLSFDARRGRDFTVDDGDDICQTPGSSESPLQAPVPRTDSEAMPPVPCEAECSLAIHMSAMRAQAKVPPKTIAVKSPRASSKSSDAAASPKSPVPAEELAMSPAPEPRRAPQEKSQLQREASMASVASTIILDVDTDPGSASQSQGPSPTVSPKSLPSVPSASEAEGAAERPATPTNAVRAQPADGSAAAMESSPLVSEAPRTRMRATRAQRRGVHRAQSI